MPVSAASRRARRAPPLRAARRCARRTCATAARPCRRSSPITPRSPSTCSRIAARGTAIQLRRDRPARREWRPTRASRRRRWSGRHRRGAASDVRPGDRCAWLARSAVPIGRSEVPGARVADLDARRRLTRRRSPSMTHGVDQRAVGRAEVLEPVAPVVAGGPRCARACATPAGRPAPHRSTLRARRSRRPRQAPRGKAPGRAPTSHLAVITTIMPFRPVRALT